MTRSALILAACLALAVAGCDSAGNLTPKAQQIVGVLCQKDAAIQPIAVSVAPILLPQTTPIAQLDQVVVHPLVQSACQGIGKPVGVQTPSPTGGVVTVTTAPAGAALNGLKQ